MLTLRASCLALIVLLLCSSLALAQTKSFMGTVQTVKSNQLTVSTTNGDVTVVITPKTTLPANPLQAGQRVRVFYVEADLKVATQIELLP